MAPMKPLPRHVTFDGADAAVVRACLPRDLAAACSALVSRPDGARLLRVLRLEIAVDHRSNAPAHGVDFHYDESLEIVAGSEVLSALRVLSLRCDDYPLERTHVGAIPSFREGLSELRLRVGDARSLDGLALPTLVTLELELGRIDAENVRSIGRAELPALESLRVVADSHEGVAPSDLTLLLDGAGVPRLRALALRNLGELEPAVAALVASPLLRRLEALELPSPCWDEASARVLLRHAAAFAHLRSLSLGQFDGDRGTLDALRSIGPVVDVLARVLPPPGPFNPPPPR
jgi:hypothetical protein